MFFRFFLKGLKYGVIVFVLVYSFFDFTDSLQMMRGSVSELYGVNEFEGAKLSRKITSVVPKGSIFAANQYEDFLIESTSIIGSTSDIGPFVGVASPLAIQGAIFNDDEYFLGVPKFRRIKVEPIVGDLAVLQGRWGRAHAESGESYPIYVDSVESRSVIKVAGELRDFVKLTHIELDANPQTDADQYFYMDIQNEVMNLIRGGVFIAGGGSHISLTSIGRNVPFLRNSGLPRKGDSVLIGGEKRLIVSVVPQHNTFVIELDSPIPPYETIFANVVKIEPSFSSAKLAVKLPVSLSETQDFFLGKERFRHVHVEGEFTELGVNSFLTESGVVYDGALIKDQNNNLTIEFDLKATYDRCTHESREMSEKISLDDIRRRYVRKELSEPCKVAAIGSLEALLYANGDHRYGFAVEQISPVIVADLPSVDHQVCADPTIWEIYPGSLLNLYYDEVNPSSTNMMIHALGTELASQYYEEFAATNPSYVALAKPRQFMPWLLNWHWPFFERLMKEYDSYYENEDFSLWVNKKCTVKAYSPEYIERESFVKTGNEIRNLSSELTLISLDITYRAQNHGVLGSLPVFGRSNRFYCRFDGTKMSWTRAIPVSLNPGSGSISVPIVMRPKEAVRLNCYTDSPFGISSSFEVISVNIRPVSRMTRNILSAFYPNRMLQHEFRSGR